MTKKRDLYEVLGVAKTADDKQLKSAYRKLAKKYHPDMNPDDKEAEQKFKEATEAYNILSDPEKRKLYDQFGMDAFDNATGGAGNSRGFGGFKQGAGTNGETCYYTGGNADDILSELFGSLFGGSRGAGHSSGFSFGGDFGGFDFGEGGAYREFDNGRGQDITADIEVTWDEAALGGKKLIQLETTDGGIQRLEIHVPEGIDEGQSIRLKGKGAPGSMESGDLFLRVHVGKKAGVERKGADLYMTVNIPYTDAVFGGEVRVNTLRGNVMCKIPAGTQCGSKIRLRGKGLKYMKENNRFGDLYLTVQIEVPRDLTPSETRKLKEYGKLRENRVSDTDDRNAAGSAA